MKVSKILFIILCVSSNAFSRFAAIDTAKWIGFTEEHRPAEWAGRDIVRNQPPANIEEWVPTEKELRAVRRNAFPSSLLRKPFSLDKPIRSAKVTVCGLGLYELYLNGEKVGDRVLDPAQTTYDKRAFYVEHDVKDKLRQGNNAIGLMLGNGFYGQNIALSPGLFYGAPRALLTMTIEYEDDTNTILISDKTWLATQSPILFDNIYHGETYDARRECSGWSSSNFDASKWQPVRIMEAPTDNLVKQQMEPMRKIRAIQPIAVRPAENGEWIIDMGQNMTGWLQIQVNEPSGTEVKMRFAELLMPGGKAIDTASTGIHVTGGDQTDIYICKENGPETWEPRFTYHGFRYVQISGLSQRPDLKNYTGWLVRTDMERTGTFECSDPLITKFYKVSIWTLEDNLQGLLSDCPHRERCAWMGDIHAAGEFASFNFDMQKFWQKTSADMETVLGAASPHPTDGLPRDQRAPCNISVGKRLCHQTRPDWGAATVLVPWYSYLYYGDLQIVRDAWPMMLGWLAYLEECVVQDGIIEQGYGDWCPPGSNSQIDTPKALTSTVLYHKSLVVMAKMATDLGKTADAERYAKQSAKIKSAANARFFDAVKSDYGSQTGNAFAWHCGIVPNGKEQAVADTLASIIMKENGGHYSTGIFGHRPLYTLLNDHNHADVTSHLWSITDWPSLGFLTEQHDLTTWPEVPYNWTPGKRYMRNSFNHPMHSGFAAAFHESIGGIRPDPENPGFKRFFLKPCFLPGLEWAKVTHRSPYGLIVSHWKRSGNIVTWNISVPASSSALVQLPQFKAETIQLDGKPVKDNKFALPLGEWTIAVRQNK